MKTFNTLSIISEAKDNLQKDIAYYEKKATYPWMVEKLRTYLSFWEYLEIAQIYNVPTQKPITTQTENIPNKFYDKEAYRSYSIMMAMKKWPELF